MKKKLQEDRETAQKSYHGKLPTGRDNQYNILLNDQDENKENIRSKNMVPHQLTMVEKEKKSDNEQMRNFSERLIPSQRTKVNKREQTRAYESGYTDLAKENFRRKPACQEQHTITIERTKKDMGRNSIKQVTQSPLMLIKKGYNEEGKVTTPKIATEKLANDRDIGILTSISKNVPDKDERGNKNGKINRKEWTEGKENGNEDKLILVGAVSENP